MTMNEPSGGRQELIRARRQSRGLFWAVGLFSVFINILMLTGPIFMLQVYDRVLTSRSEATLVSLLAIVAFLYLNMAVLDFLRGRILTRIGARFQTVIEGRVLSASLAPALNAQAPNGPPGQPVGDLDAVRRFIGSPVLAALYDLPWTPVFVLAIAIFHPVLGLVAALGGAVLLALALANRFATAAPHGRAKASGRAATAWAVQVLGQAETIRALGMRGAILGRWTGLSQRQLSHTVAHEDAGGLYASASRVWRMFLQSVMLAAGAYLVLQDALTPGAMVAASILLGRALAPVELVVGQWALVAHAVSGWRSLAAGLTAAPPARVRTALPRPESHLIVDRVTVSPPGCRQAALRLVSFEVRPGQALGVIGQSGAGKTTLARALTGVWPPSGGRILLGGAPIDQYGPDAYGKLIGYLPQRVEFLEGTVAENIARMAAEPNAEKVVEAAKRAAAHELILDLPMGYDTPVSATGAPLSGGQAQRIALARALYGDPALLILDEPNASLDNAGSDALNAAVRGMKRSGKAVLIMAHRPAAIQECDVLLMLDEGARKAFGPKDVVLQQMVQNHGQIAAARASGVA